MNKYILILFFLILFCSCVKKEENLDIPKYKIDISQIQDFPIDSLIDSVFYIDLETTEFNVIGEIKKLQVDSFITISDEMTNTLQFYSKTGAFLSSITRIGNGPGEYVHVDDFIVHSNKQIVEVLDGTQNKIIEYSFNGEIKKEKKINMPPGIARFAAIDSTYIYDQQIRRNTPENCFNLLVTSTNGDILNKYLPYKLFSDITLSPRNSLFYVNDTLVYLPIYSNTLYTIANDGIMARYSFDFEDKWLDENYLYSAIQNPMSFVKGLKDTEGIYFLNVTETASHILLDFMYKDKTFYAIVDKSNSKVILCKESISSNCMVKYAPMTSWGDFFVIPINREELPVLSDNESTENMNPALMFFKFKRL